MACHGFNCKNTALIAAHIIPAAFGRSIRDDSPNMQLTWHRVGRARQQLGEIDTQILCADCDRRLGVFDGYAVRTCRRFEGEHTTQGEIFELKRVDGDKFAKFILAVLWRASISRRTNFSGVSFGPAHNEEARRVLFGVDPLSSFWAFQVIVERYVSDTIANVEGFYTHPVRSRSKRAVYNFYGFSVGGFRVLAKLDARRFPRGLARFVVNGNDSLRGTFVKLEETETHSVILEMLAADASRT